MPPKPKGSEGSGSNTPSVSASTPPTDLAAAVALIATLQTELAQLRAQSASSSSSSVSSAKEGVDPINEQTGEESHSSASPSVTVIRSPSSSATDTLDRYRRKLPILKRDNYSLWASIMISFFRSLGVSEVAGPESGYLTLGLDSRIQSALWLDIATSVEDENARYIIEATQDNPWRL
jgi:hypothetical protein